LQNILKFLLLFFVTIVYADVNSSFDNTNNINLSLKQKKWLKNHPVIKLGKVSVFEPLFTDSNSGIIPDLYEIVAKRLDVKFEYISTPNMISSLTKLQEKNLDAIPALNGKLASHKGLVTVDSPFDLFTTVFAKKGNTYKIYKDSDIKNLRIGYYKDLIYLDKYLESIKDKQNVTLFKTSSTLEAIKAVVDDKVDIMIGLNTDSYLITKNLISEIKPIFTLKNIDSDTVIAVRSDYKIFADILTKAFNSISLLEKNNILKKWTLLPSVSNIKKENILLSDDIKRKLSPQEAFFIDLSDEQKAYLKRKKVLTVSNLATFPPFNFFENNTTKGFSIDYMNLIGKYLDVNIEFISGKPWNEYLNMLKNKKIDLIPHVAVNNERKEYIDFTNFNHIEYTTGMAVNKNTNIKSMSDLKNKTIAVTNKSFIHTYLKDKFPNYKLKLTSSTATAVDAVSSGEADAVIGSLPALNYYIQKNWLSNVKTIIISDYGRATKVALPMAVSKGNILLKSILEKANESIPHSEVVRLRQKWMNLNSIDKKNNNLNIQEIKYLKDKKIIKMCVLPNWLPFEQIDKNGNHKGIGADIMKIVSKYIDTPIELVKTEEWAESLQNIRDKKCDILPVAMDVPSRRDAMNFTKPYVSEPFVIATKSDELFIKDAQSISNRKVGIVKSYAFIDVLKQKNPSIQITNVENTKEGLEKVSSGELFGYIDTMPTIGYGIQKYSMFDLKIAGKLEFDITLSVASRNDEPILNTIMQKALDSISQEKRRTIIGRWIEIKVAHEFDYKLLWQVSAFFLVIVLTILYKNRAVNTLNKKLTQQQKMVNKYVLILSTDLKGNIIDVNDAYCKATGYTKKELLNNTHKVMRHPEMKKEYFDKMWSDIEQNKHWVGEVKNYTKDNQTVCFTLFIEPILKNNVKIGYRSISENITDKKRIEKLSVTDQLTQLNNRLKLDSVFKYEIAKAKRFQHSFSVILLDIDFFKSINDTYGHDIGDETLKDIAKILQNSVRETDIIGRWGGEEFLILASETNLKNAMRLSQKIRKNIELHSFKMIGHKTASFGVSTFSSGDTQEILVKRADEALYKAKTNGRNQVVTIESMI